MERTKKVAVIGAGICGIGAMLSVLEENMDLVCFEASDNHAGLWHYHDDDIAGLASVMKTTIINNSKELGCMGSFTFPAEYPNFMHNKEIYGYLDKILKDRDMIKYIRYNKRVTKVKFAADYQATGRYNVTTEDTKNGDVETGTYDAVFVCVGHHVFPNWVTFPGQEKFKGRITHTHSLKKVDVFTDKNVVIVGLGNSAADAAVEISNVSNQVYLSTRRGAWIMPRIGPRGLPVDYYFNRRCVFFLQQLSYDIFCRVIEAFVNFHFDHSLYNLQPDHHILSQHPTVSDALPVRLACGTVVVRGNIKMFTENGVIFDGETEVTPVDEVVLATGYVTKFPFLGEEITTIKNNETHLYKFMYPPHLPHPTLAILGLVQPLGAGVPVGEAQCRLASYSVSGRVKLPSREEMEADIAAYKQIFKNRFVQSPRHAIQCDFISYLDEIHGLIGTKPNLVKIFFTDPKLWWAIMFGPHLPQQYRLQGPHTWDGARNAILTCRDRVIKPLKQGYRKNLKTELTYGKLLTRDLVLDLCFMILKAVLLISVMWFFFPSFSKLYAD